MSFHIIKTAEIAAVPVFEAMSLLFNVELQAENCDIHCKFGLESLFHKLKIGFGASTQFSQKSYE